MGVLILSLPHCKKCRINGSAEAQDFKARTGHGSICSSANWGGSRIQRRGVQINGCGRRKLLGGPGACSPRKFWKLGPHKCNFQQFKMQVEDVHFLKIHPSFALTSKNKKEKKLKRNLLKNRGDNNEEKLWIESPSQLNKATGLRGVIPAMLKIEGT